MTTTALAQQVRVLAAPGHRHDEILTPPPWTSSAPSSRRSSPAAGTC
ncbi:hypothetical protein GA0115242_11922 [Streptomyces sp. SolWspMP-5a-2]|nr:hypothetical protein GA0115242_11922 [Streptomyces sp. SolWspMP-5a-2]